jgi:hypothetical protein
MAVIGVVAVLALGVAGVLVYKFVFDDGPSGSGHSSSYQAGYTSGTNGPAHFGAQMGGDPRFNDVACESAQISAGPNIDPTEFQQGCMDALRDHPPSHGG